ncbi:MAG: hypothetical protein ACRDLQ_01900 [Solirubrobacterales bacterium]
MTTATRTGGWRATCLAGVLAIVLAAAGCGDDEGGPQHPADDQELVEQVIEKIERAAAASANPVRDRYIPGPKTFKVVCLSPEEARAKNVGPEFIQCHVEAFSTPSKRRPESVYVESEDWRVPVEPDGTVGDPVIVDGYRIRDFLREDHRLGCSVGKTPQERCKGAFAQNP